MAGFAQDMNLLDTTPTEFTTERLVIRRCDPAFTDDLYTAAVASVATVYPFLPWCHPDYQRQDASQWLTHARDNWGKNQYAFSIFDQNGTLVGGCGVNRVDDHPVANLGYWIRSSAEGLGYASEATRGLASFAIKHTGLKRLEIIMATHNAASRAVAIKSGADYEGVLKNRLELHGELFPAYLYSITSLPN